MSKVAVIGAGVMGLASAYHLLRAGHQVEIFEADRRAGGMAAHFDFEGLSLERYYHFICKADKATFALLAELGLSDTVRWRTTSMGYFYQGNHYSWGNPLALLRFPHLDLISKARYGFHMFMCTKRRDWSALDKISADLWIKSWIGERAWKVLWEKLFTLKFFEHAQDISAAWIWTRIKRIGTSRRNLMQEELGYIEGGSETLINRLVDRIQSMGGKVHLSAAVSRVHIEDETAKGITINDEYRAFDNVICTVPLPLIPRLIPDLPRVMKEQYANVKNIGVICVVHKLKKRITPHFWLNINDDRIDVPGIVEFSNLRSLGEDHVVFFPYYMPSTHPKFSQTEESFVQESFGYLKLLNPDLGDEDRSSSHVSRLRYAQPVCGPRFLDDLPPIATSIRGLQIADTSSYYPEDRGISESARIAMQMAERVG